MVNAGIYKQNGKRIKPDSTRLVIGFSTTKPLKQLVKVQNKIKNNSEADIFRVGSNKLQLPKTFRVKTQFNWTIKIVVRFST